MESLTAGLPEQCVADKTTFFMVMPTLPYNQQQLFPAASYYGNWIQQGAVGIDGYLTNPTSPPPFVILFDREEAHKKAEALSKQQHSPYYVAQFNVLGQYVPPPPEWKPAYVDVWTKP